MRDFIRALVFVVGIACTLFGVLVLSMQVVLSNADFQVRLADDRVLFLEPSIGPCGHEGVAGRTLSTDEEPPPPPAEKHFPNVQRL